METRKIKKEKSYELHISDSSDTYLIIKETNDFKQSTIERKNFRIHTGGHNKEVFNEKRFEVLELTNKVFNPFIKNLFSFIVEQDKTLSSSIKEIESFFESDELLNLELARGVFAEMSVLILDKSIKSNHANAIYDFVRGGTDLEIKSCSTASPNIKISKQQATNSKNAVLMCVVVVESSEGESIIELLKKYDVLEGRYSRIANSKSKFINTKFKVEETWEANMRDIFGELKLPELVDDATFTLNARRLKK